MNTAYCPFCGQTVPINPGFQGPTFAQHKNGDAICNGWGKSVAKSEELLAAVLDMLKVIQPKMREE